MFPGSKRRVCWKFGFANSRALEDGLSGQDCRGEEHEIVMVWSLTSGKQFVLADGHEVHWSKSSLSRRRFYQDKFECSWEMSSGHKLSIVAHAPVPFFEKKQKTDGSFRQFDLIVDGVSYSNMPQMFQLGSSSVRKNTAVTGRQYGQAPSIARADVDVVAQQQSQSHSRPGTNENQQQQHHHHQGRPQISSMDAAFFRSEPRLSLMDDVSRAGSISPSPSMPDLMCDYVTTSTTNSTLGSLLSTPNKTPVSSYNNTCSSLSLSTASPTSVMMTNPFDLYSSPPIMPQPLPLHQSPYHYNNTHKYHTTSQQMTWNIAPPLYSPQRQLQQYSAHYGQQQQYQQHHYHQQHGVTQQVSSSSSSLSAPAVAPSTYTPHSPAVYAGY